MNASTIQFEVRRPNLLSRVEQRHDLSSRRPIDRTKVATLIAVAPIAAQAEVVFGSLPAMFL
ncbi:MAG: hypothetical protein SGI73_08065, partial [Chloroflexota bacterium]|nr:hypothetical protein [Chloroflexota bacterium]